MDLQRLRMVVSLSSIYIYIYALKCVIDGNFNIFAVVFILRDLRATGKYEWLARMFSFSIEWKITFEHMCAIEIGDRGKTNSNAWLTVRCFMNVIEFVFSLHTFFHSSYVWRLQMLPKDRWIVYNGTWSIPKSMLDVVLNNIHLFITVMCVMRAMLNKTIAVLFPLSLSSKANYH